MSKMGLLIAAGLFAGITAVPAIAQDGAGEIMLVANPGGLAPAAAKYLPAAPANQSRAAPAAFGLPGESDRAVYRGAECPTNSGAYCSDEFPVCCLVNNQYRCFAKLSDCGK